MYLKSWSHINFCQRLFHPWLTFQPGVIISESGWMIHLTHRGWVTHICVGNQTIIGSDKGLSPGRRQAIIWTNVGILLVGHSGRNFSEILIEIHPFSFKKMHLKMSSAKFCVKYVALANKALQFTLRFRICPNPIVNNSTRVYAKVWYRAPLLLTYIS